MSKLFTLAVAIFAIGATPACNRTTHAERPRIALVLKTLNNPFFIDMRKGAITAAERLNVELIVQSAERETDIERQMQIIENLVQAGVAAICIAPSGSKEIVPAVGKAKRAGIPVVIVDDRIDAQAAAEAGVHTDAYVGSDNVEGGRIAGRHLIEITGGRATVALLEGIPGHQTGDARLQGFSRSHHRIGRHPRRLIADGQLGARPGLQQSSRTCWRPTRRSMPCSRATT